MKKLLLIIGCLCYLGINVGYSQAKKPTLMVVPSQEWCITNGYYIEVDDQGTKTKIPNYKKAFQENANMNLVISAMNGIMAERGFPMKSMESAIKTLESESAEDNMRSSKSGAGISESPVDKLKKVAKADIILNLSYTVSSTGPKKSITFNLAGIDAYTDKQIATATGTGAPSFSAELPVLLKEAVMNNMDNFNSQLQAHFEDMLANGREIIIRIKKFDADIDLEKEYDGKELSAHIEDWLKTACVKGRFSTSEATENMMLFEQVRIPLYDDKGNATDARGFVKGLQNFLKAAPYNLTSKLTMKGLGQAALIIGEK